MTTLAKPLEKIREVDELQPRVIERLRLGQWRAMHVRLQGDRARTGGSPLRALAAVPKEAAWGWLDWICLHMQESHPLILELKSEKGVVSEDQRRWLAHWLASGAEIAVVRPRDTYPWPPGEDPLHLRLVEHHRTAGWQRAIDEALSEAARAGREPPTLFASRLPRAARAAVRTTARRALGGRRRAV